MLRGVMKAAGIAGSPSNGGASLLEHEAHVRGAPGAPEPREVAPHFVDDAVVRALDLDDQSQEIEGDLHRGALRAIVRRRGQCAPPDRGPACRRRRTAVRGAGSACLAPSCRTPPRRARPFRVAMRGTRPAPRRRPRGAPRDRAVRSSPGRARCARCRRVAARAVPSVEQEARTARAHDVAHARIAGEQAEHARAVRLRLLQVAQRAGARLVVDHAEYPGDDGGAAAGRRYRIRLGCAHGGQPRASPPRHGRNRG